MFETALIRNSRRHTRLPTPIVGPNRVKPLHVSSLAAFDRQNFDRDTSFELNHVPTIFALRNINEFVANVCKVRMVD